MSAYDNDPRVWDMGFDCYTVKLDNGGSVDVEPRRSGPGFLRFPHDGVTLGIPSHIFPEGVFPDADAAIRSLIGDPQ